jgi:AbrB family looped-hinge helix DNA binding protein
MTSLIEIRTVTVTEKGQIAIPKNIRKLEGFKEGTKIAILAFKNKVELRPLKQFNERLFPALASEKSLAKDWLSKEEDQAWKNL